MCSLAGFMAYGDLSGELRQEREVHKSSKETKSSKDCSGNITNARKLYVALKVCLLAHFLTLLHLICFIYSIHTCLEPALQKVSVEGSGIRTHKLYELSLLCVSTAFCSPAPNSLSNTCVHSSLLPSSLGSNIHKSSYQPISCATGALLYYLLVQWLVLTSCFLPAHLPQLLPTPQCCS